MTKLDKELLEEIIQESPEYYAVFGAMGIVNRTFMSVPLAKVNKIMAAIHLEKVRGADYTGFVDQIKNRKSKGYTVYEQFSSNNVDVDFLKELVNGQTPGKTTPLAQVLNPYHVDKQKELANAREFNQIQRNGAYMAILMEGVRDHLSKELKHIDVNYTLSETTKERKDRTVIVNLSDLHIGALVINKQTGGYNFSILLERLEEYKREVTKVIELFKPNRIVLNGLGDYIEHINMRNVNQAFEAEFTATEQVAKATKVLLDFLLFLNTFELPVDFYMILGNHDRFVGNKSDAIYNDSVAYIILDTLLLLKESSDILPYVSIYDNREDMYNARYQVNGLNVVLDHGTTLKGFGSNVAKFIKDERVDLLITGHVHHSKQTQEDYKRFHVVVSSPMGANNYSKELKLNQTTPSQTILITGSDIKGFISYPVFLEGGK